MNAERLLQLYDRIAEAPDAVSRLRRFVLDLAVRGKLVEQDLEDEPVLERLPVEAQAHSSTDLPTGWYQAKVGELLEFQYGKGLKKRERLESGPVPVFGSNGIVGFTDTPLTSSPSIIIGRKGSAGALNICERPSWTTDVAYFIEEPEFYILRFLYIALFTLGLDALGKGVKPGLSRADAYELLLPVPPISEQHRIVAKVDELMILCDRLEETHNTRETTRDRMTTATLTRLTAPDTEKQSFRDHARFTLDTLPALTARPDQIKSLRQTILDLAMRGKLVEQDPEDESASNLLRQVDRQRTKLLAENYPNAPEARTQLKKLSEQRIPDGFPELPCGWKWATLQQCSLLVVDCKNKTAPYSSSGIKLVRTTNVRNGRLNSIDQKYVTETTYRKWSARCFPEPGDILITREAPMGEVCLVPPGEKICLGQRMMLARLVPQTIDPRFMLYSLRDPHLMERVQDKPLGMTVQHLRVGGVESLLVPLPPLAEQHRIVAKLDELMALCDRLEACLQKAEKKRARLLESLLAKALAPAIDELEALNAATQCHLEGVH